MAGTRAIVRGPQKGGSGTGDVAGQFGAAQADFLEIDRAHRPGVGGAAELAVLVDRPALALAPNLLEMRVEIVVDDLVHQPELVKGVARIGDAARRLGLDAVLLEYVRPPSMTGNDIPCRLISSRFSRITTVDLTSSPDMPAA